MKKLLPLISFTLLVFAGSSQCPSILGTSYVDVYNIPYYDLGHNTAGDGDDLTYFNVANACDPDYLSGEDFVYVFHTPYDHPYYIIMENQSDGYGGFQVFQGCPDFGNCVGSATSDSGYDELTIDLLGGITYYIVADVFAPPGSYTYDFIIDCAAVPPSNDVPNTATKLNVNPACVSTLGNNQSAGDFTGAPNPSCANYNGNDVWYYAIVPSTGAFKVNTSALQMNDSGLSAYTRSSTMPYTYTEIACDDDSGPGFMSSITLTGRTPGDTIYFRVWSYNNTNNGTFNICSTIETVLPVTFGKISAQAFGTSNKVEWETYEEVNSDVQILEKSAYSTNNWTVVGEVSSLNNGRSNKYSLYDEQPAPLTYYRIKAVDLDGRYEYSYVVSARNANVTGNQRISLYPNPVTETSRLIIPSDEDRMVTYSVTGIDGKLIFTREIQINTGVNELDLKLNDLGSGLYFVTVKDGMNQQTIKFFKD